MTRFLLVCLGLMIVPVAMVHAERYQVIVDRFGNLDAERSEKPEGFEGSQELAKPEGDIANADPAPLETQLPDATASDALTNSATAAASEPLRTSTQADPESLQADSIARGSAAQTLPANTSSLQSPNSQSALENDADLVADPNTQTDVRGQSGELAPESTTEAASEKPPRKLSKFEQVFLENEGRNPYDATVINEEDFVDGDELLQGRVSNDSQRPFFITRDPDGNESVTFYSPSLAKEARDQAKYRLMLSKATVYKESDQDGAYLGELPTGADPMAVKILTAGKGVFENYFDAFSRRCCSTLPKAGVKVLEFDRSEHLKVLPDSLPYRFNEGDSRYLIFKLPVSSENYIIQLRAFIRKFKDEGVENGVFYPQLVMLDAELNPLRIIANPVLEYTPESWSDYGYLQGVFEVDRTENSEETYALLNTTRDSLNKVSQYDSEEGRIVIEHMRHGELGVKALSMSELTSR